jgi:hypothetical protein
VSCPNRQSWRSDSVVPLAHPLDELLTVHRVSHTGGLVLRGAASSHRGRAVVVLGHGPGAAMQELSRGWSRFRSSLGSGDRVVIRADEKVVRAYGEVSSTEPGRRPIATLARVEAIHTVRDSDLFQARRLSEEEGISELLTATLAPVHGPEMVERLLVTAERVQAGTGVIQVEVPTPQQPVPFAWGHRHASMGFSAPAFA